MIDRTNVRGCAVVAAELEDLVNDRAVFALELASDDRRRRLIRVRLMIDAQHAVGVGRSAAERRAMEPRQQYRKPAAGEPHALGDFGNDADLRVRLVVPGNEKDAVVGADVHGECDRHPREHHRVLEGNNS